ncbi:MAG TPA: DUF5719 family protein, partial [Phycisphaerales bacterium]|nr:DUF5719 family protein [Phycisphaerales bacterium]
WTFAEANRDPAVYRDFLIFYNPNDGGTTVTVELFYDDGTVVSFDRSLAALRRGGVNFNDDLSVPKSGRFSVRVSAPVPIVAALSSYDIANGRGYGLLGSAGGGATEGVVPFVTAGGGVESSVAIFNDSASPATVTLVATYLRVDLPELVRVFNVPAGGRVSVPMTQLGLSQGQAAGLKYFADTPVTVNYREYQFGDGDASATATHGITTGIIGDAFVNPSGAGITYIERLNLFNPTGVESSVQITYLFTDGTTAVRNVTIAPGRFSIVAVDAEPAILNRVEPTAFSIRLDSSLPFVAGFIHYDLFLAGGWSTLASPIGLTNELSLI